MSDNTLTLECNKREVRDDVARRAKCGNKRPFRAVAFGYSAKSSFHEIGNGGAFGGIGRIFRANDERFGEAAFEVGMAVELWCGKVRNVVQTA